MNIRNKSIKTVVEALVYVLAIFCMIVVLSVPYTFAIFTTRANTDVSIEMGKVGFELIDHAGNDLNNLQYNNAEMEMGKEYALSTRFDTNAPVMLRNVSSEEVYLRIKTDLYINGSTGVNYGQYVIIKNNASTTSFLKQDNLYYFVESASSCKIPIYDSVLGSPTIVLFDTFSISNTLPSEVQGLSLRLTISIEVIQTTGAAYKAAWTNIPIQWYTNSGRSQ